MYLQFNFTGHWVKCKGNHLTSGPADAEGAGKWTEIDELDGETGVVLERIVGADFTVRRPTEVGKVVH